MFSERFTDKVFGFLDMMEEFETEGSCSGVCQPGLFWFTQPVTLERPEEACLGNMLEAAIEDEIEDRSQYLTKLQNWGSGASWGNQAQQFGGSQFGGQAFGAAGASGGQNGQPSPQQILDGLNWVQKQNKEYINLGITVVLGSLYILSLFVPLPAPAPST